MRIVLSVLLVLSIQLSTGRSASRRKHRVASCSASRVLELSCAQKVECLEDEHFDL